MRNGKTSALAINKMMRRRPHIGPRLARYGLALNVLLPSSLPCALSVEEQPACFVVRDHDGQQLAYVYFEEEPGRRSAAKLLTKDEAVTALIGACVYCCANACMRLCADPVEQASRSYAHLPLGIGGAARTRCCEIG
jgi:hypothetical protein